jgi:hypothetical protein
MVLRSCKVREKYEYEHVVVNDSLQKKELCFVPRVEAHVDDGVALIVYYFVSTQCLFAFYSPNGTQLFKVERGSGFVWHGTLNHRPG